MMETARPISETDARLDDLRVLAALADHPSLTAAAAALGLPKQTVSRRIGALERAVGARLVERTSRRMRLSEDGAALADRAREIVRLADEAVQAARDTVDVPRGTLRIAATHTVAERICAPLLCDYLAQHPQVRVELVLGERLVDLAEEGFDVAIRVGVPPPSELVATRLGPARIRYVASPGYLAARPRTSCGTTASCTRWARERSGGRSWRPGPPQGSSWSLSPRG
jgi:LysR family transcriptional regulator, regulator for bpeEF and oprC